MITRDIVDAYADAIANNGNSRVRVFQWQTPANGFQPWDKRYYTAHGFAIRYEEGPLAGDSAGERRYVLAGEEVREWTGDAFIIDDGVNVIPYFVAAYRLDGAPEGVIECDPHLILVPFRPANHQTPYESMAPRRCHHVQLSE